MNLFNIARDTLGEPAIDLPGVMIYQMDCIEALSKLPEGLVDITVTSPPYNIGKDYESVMPVEEYVAWSQQWIKQVYRLGNSRSSFWLNIGYLSIKDKGLAIPIPYLLWDKTDFYLMQEIVWNYGAGVACKNMLSPRNEKVLWYIKDPKNYTFNLDPIRDKDVKYPNQKKNGKLRVNPLGKNPSDVWQIPKVTSGKDRSSVERTKHPAQFPEALIDRIILGGSNISEFVLDPFMGSGTTAVCALKNGRNILGFEVDPRSIEIAKSRITKFLDEENSKLF